nr:FHA domain-containing protein [uncultured Halomonas sp.]
MPTDDREIDDRKTPPVAESTPPLGATEPDDDERQAGGPSVPANVCEPEDAERTPTTDTLAPAPTDDESAIAANASGAGEKTKPNALRLHDKASNAHAVVGEFPATIGNSPACDLALKGPGPVGVYARLRHERSAFIIEKAHSEVPLVVNEKELRSVILMDGDVLMLGEHEVHVRFARVEADVEQEQSRNKRKNRLRVIGAIALVIVLLMIVSMAWSYLTEREAPLPAPKATTENIADHSAAGSWNDPADDASSLSAKPSPPSIAASSPVEPSRPAPLSESPRVAENLGSDTPSTPPPTSSAIDQWDSPEPAALSPPVASEPPRPADTVSDSNPQPQPQPSASDSQASARQLAVTAAIEEATDLYVAGNGEQAIGRLHQASAELQGDAGDRLQTMRERLDQALNAYRGGLAAIDAGRPLEMVRQRDRLASAERPLDTTQLSAYRRELDAAALIAYRSWAREADNQNATATAYRWYRRILSIAPLDAEAARRIAALDQAAKEQYLTGYRLETKDIKSALLYWRNAASMVPGASRWHRLASEKLDDYANFKTRS